MACCTLHWRLVALVPDHCNMMPLSREQLQERPHLLLGAGAAALLALAVWRRRRRAAAQRAEKERLRREFTEDDEVLAPRVPGNGTPVLHGVRVVDLGTVVAGPACAEAMA